MINLANRSQKTVQKKNIIVNHSIFKKVGLKAIKYFFTFISKSHNTLSLYHPLPFFPFVFFYCGPKKNYQQKKKGKIKKKKEEVRNVIYRVLINRDTRSF